MIKRIISWLNPLSRHVTYTIKDGLAAGLRRKGGFGFVPRPAAPLTKDERHLQGLDLTGKVVYDIGGYQGIYTLFFARAVGPSGRVVCFEAHPDNAAVIQENIRINGFEDRASVRHLALGDKKGTVSLVVPDSGTGRSTVEPTLQASFDTSAQTTDRLTVPMNTLDSQLGSVPAPGLLKIDVEGAEVAVLQGATDTLRRHRPSLFVELHGTTHEDKRQRAVAVLTILDQADYRVTHIATGAVLTPATPPTVGSGSHLFAVPR